ncbi:DUF3159 domain-containing protein [Nesterenkonia sp. MY13]|uniref:DUF3159 domain-containing protein n=1 Tax=Nesterenkonia sedimenti TaxID=1463632 RepID=A0A7X8YD57_9MICC|nr:DUF3159 domain-containing protein [Nesterenkonia sedimenti]NLS08782.1 DUF3159 domain-containing protein [Nesterenkonia sedimenti]
MSGSSANDDVGRQISASAGKRISTREDGSLDVMASVGGVRGIAEAALPATAFLTAYLLTDELTTAILISVGIGAVFTIIRLAQRGSLIQSFSGLIGVAICAAFAHFSGEARGYYVPGFFVNAGYILALSVSILVRWPLLGVLFGTLVRGEGFDWRQDRSRRRRYALATWIITAVLASRLIVQVPLYFADNETALGVTRVVMGVPLYAFALWIGWMITRPEVLAADTASAVEELEKEEGQR